MTKTPYSPDQFPHAHAEPHKGKWRVVITEDDGSQQVFRSGLPANVAQRIAASLRTVDNSSKGE